jgi:hypothetical protein
MAKDRKTRGRTSITGPSKAGHLGPRGSNPMSQQERRMDVNRPQGAGGGKLRGDRRDTHPTFTGNAKHSARGRTGRVKGGTRKG